MIRSTSLRRKPGSSTREQSRLRSKRNPRNRRRLSMEALESRRVLATFLVTTLDDGPIDSTAGDGQLSLREAIEAANMNISVDGSPVGMEGEFLDGFELVMDEILFDGNLQGELNLTEGVFLLEDSVRIRGNGADRVALNAGGASRHFEFAADASGTVEVNNLTLRNGNATGDGGAILMSEQSGLFLTGMNFTNNSASGNGGAVASRSLIIKRSSFVDNSAGGDGGGLFGAAVDASESLFANNFAGERGGGYSTRTFGRVQIRNTTIVGNEAGTNGAGAWHGAFDSSDSITSSIVAGNFLTNGTPKDFGRTSLGDFANEFAQKTSYNIFGTDVTGNGVENQVDVDWKTVVENDGQDPIIADNGGSLPTLRILPDGPAIDAGDPDLPTAFSVDQRSGLFARIEDGDEDGSARVDIGAIEEERTFVRVSIHAVDDIVTEASTVRFRVELNREVPAGQTLAIQLNVSPDSTATNGEDYNFTSQELTFEPGGALSQLIEIPTIGNNFAEPAESLILTATTGQDFALLEASQKTASVTIADDDEAGLVVNKTSMLLHEDGSVTDSFSVALTSPPTGDVEIRFFSKFGTPVNPTRLFFDPQNWNQPQEVSVVAAQNDVAQGDRIEEITVLSDRRSAAPYDDVPRKLIEATLIDDDELGMVIEPITMVSDESGGQASFSLSFKSAFGSGGVIVPIQSLDPSEGVPTVESIMILGSEWNVPRIITIDGIDDADQDGPVEYTIQLGPMTGSNLYADYVGPLVTLVNNDNETDSYDFGDAPTAEQSGFAADYPVSAGSDGARHIVGDLR
ncbi:MAG: Calx-beta domain-containing protein, partial [Planctomycetota bacterium]